MGKESTLTNTTAQQTIELRADGYKYYYLSLVFWGTALWFATIGMHIAINRLYVYFGVDSFEELELMRVLWPALTVAFLHIGKWLAAIGVVWTLCEWFYTARYRAKEKTVFYYTNAAERMMRAVNTSYDLLHQVKTEEWMVDSVVGVSVTQPTFGRLFDAGTIHLRIATFMNADARTTSLVFHGISNPHVRKEELMRVMPKHEGLRIKQV